MTNRTYKNIKCTILTDTSALGNNICYLNTINKIEQIIKKNITQNISVLDIKGKLDELDIITKLKSNVVFNLAVSLEKDFSLEYKVVEKLEMMKIPYTGTNSKILKLCSSRLNVKSILEINQIKTPKIIMINKINNHINEINNYNNVLIVLKPIFEHSVKKINIIGVPFSNIRYYNIKEIGCFLIEKFIGGNEYRVLSVNLLDKNFIGIIRITNNYRKYVGKVITDSHEYYRILKNITIKLNEIFFDPEIIAYDIIIDRNNTLYVIDINPNPGLSDKGFFYEGLFSANVSYNNFITSLLINALNKDIYDFI